MSLAGSILEHDHKPLRVFTSTENLSRVAWSRSSELIAVGTESRVQVISVKKDQEGRWTIAEVVATWELNSEVSAMDWSPRSNSTYHEIAVALGRTSTLAVLTFTPEVGPQIQHSGVGVSSGKIHEVRYGRTTGQEQLLASVGDDGVLYLFDLGEDNAPHRLIPHPQPLRSVCFHPQIASQILTIDSRGLARIWNWQTSTLLLDLTEPQSSAARGTRGDGANGEWNTAYGGASLGAVVAGRWVIWDLKKLRGGKPAGYGTAYGDEVRGRELFRWHPRNARRFATLCTTPFASPALKLYSTSYPQAPRTIDIAPTPMQAEDMSWSPTGEVIAVVVGRDLVFVDASE